MQTKMLQLLQIIILIRSVQRLFHAVACLLLRMAETFDQRRPPGCGASIHDRANQKRGRTNHPGEERGMVTWCS